MQRKLIGSIGRKSILLIGKRKNVTSCEKESEEEKDG